MATRSNINIRAQQGGMTRGKPKGKGYGTRRTLASLNMCSCHPKQYGLKKGLRRARRRVDKVLARQVED